MARESVSIQKTVLNKEQSTKVLKKEFNFFAQPAPAEEEFTVEDLFVEYDRLFLEIPVLGTTVSHEYLLARSGELLSIEKDTSDIEPLLNEITQLREQNLELQQQLTESLISQASNGV